MFFFKGQLFIYIYTSIFNCHFKWFLEYSFIVLLGIKLHYLIDLGHGYIKFSVCLNIFCIFENFHNRKWGWNYVIWLHLVQTLNISLQPACNYEVTGDIIHLRSYLAKYLLGCSLFLLFNAFLYFYISHFLPWLLKSSWRLINPTIRAYFITSYTAEFLENNHYGFNWF